VAARISFAYFHVPSRRKSVGRPRAAGGVARPGREVGGGGRGVEQEDGARARRGGRSGVEEGARRWPGRRWRLERQRARRGSM
jgi:hypothetical protein